MHLNLFNFGRKQIRDIPRATSPKPRPNPIPGDYRKENAKLIMICENFKGCADLWSAEADEMIEHQKAAKSADEVAGFAEREEHARTIAAHFSSAHAEAVRYYQRFHVPE